MVSMFLTSGAYNFHFVLFFYVLPRAFYGYIWCGFIPSAVWRFSYYFQLFRCRNLVFNGDIFPSLVAGMWGVVRIGGICMPLYIEMPHMSGCPPYLPCTSICSSCTICSPNIMRTLGGILHLMSWGLWVASVHLSGISLSVSTSISSKFITVIPVDFQHCGLLLTALDAYGCLLSFMLLFVSL